MPHRCREGAWRLRPQISTREPRPTTHPSNTLPSTRISFHQQQHSVNMTDIKPTGDNNRLIRQMKTATFTGKAAYSFPSYSYLCAE